MVGETQTFNHVVTGVTRTDKGVDIKTEDGLVLGVATATGDFDNLAGKVISVEWGGLWPGNLCPTFERISYKGQTLYPQSSQVQ